MREVFVSSAIDGETLYVLGAGGERVDKHFRRLERRHPVSPLDERERLTTSARTADKDVGRRLRKEASIARSSHGNRYARNDGVAGR